MTDNESNYVTIKEFSEMAGVSTQRIYQMISNDLKDFCKVFGKVKKIDIKALKLFGKLHRQKTNNIANNNQAVIDALLAQLETKDKQIFELQNVIKIMQEQHLALTKSLSNSQALHAGTIKEHIDSSTSNNETKQAKRKNLFSWLFNKK